MKKKLAIMLCLLTLFVLTTACGFETPTTHSEKESYGVGEEVIIRDNTSNGILGRMTITDIWILKEEDFTVRTRYGTDSEGKPLYSVDRYEAVVQMNYVASTADIQDQIDGDNFTIYDASGYEALKYPNTSYTRVPTSQNSIVFAVKEKGDHVTVDFRFHEEQMVVATIDAPYGEAPDPEQERIEEPAAEPGEIVVEQRNNQVLDEKRQLEKTSAILTRVCICLGIVNAGLCVPVVYLWPRKKKAKREILKTEGEEP